jgi:hypothetical protein
MNIQLSNDEVELIRNNLFNEIATKPDLVLPILSKIEEAKMQTGGVEPVTQTELGYFGNIWVRQNFIKEAGTSFPGHTHHFDHVSLLVKGRIRVEIDGHSAKEFSAPTFIVIKKELHHKITALEDDVSYYCVFAVRDFNGEVMDIFDENHDPRSYGKLEDGSVAELKKTYAEIVYNA